jgi:hypothetical protein
MLLGVDVEGWLDKLLTGIVRPEPLGRVDLPELGSIGAATRCQDVHTSGGWGFAALEDRRAVAGVGKDVGQALDYVADAPGTCVLGAVWALPMLLKLLDDAIKGVHTILFL